MEKGDLVWRLDILGYKGILLKQDTEEVQFQDMDPQLPFNFVNKRWKVFWFKHPFSDEPIIEDIREKSLTKIPWSKESK